MAYTYEQFERDNFLRKIPKMLQDEDIQTRVQDIMFECVPLDQIISRLLDDERLQQLFILKCIAKLPLDERLKGLSPDEIKVYLQQIESQN